MMDNGLQPFGPSSSMAQKAGEGLPEDPPRAARLFAHEPSRRQAQPNWAPGERQVGDCGDIAAVNALGR